MTAVNQLGANARKGILRQIPNLGVSRIVPSSSPTGLSTFTQQGSYPGVPVLDSPVSEMFLKATGTIPDAELPITVQTLHGGMVGLREAQWMYSQDIDADLRPVINTGTAKGSIDDLRGWEWPAHVRHYETVVWDDDPTTSQLDAVTLADGRIYQAWVSDNGAGFDILLRVRDPITGDWGDTVTVFSTTDTTRSVLLPCLVAFPDDRVIVYFFNYVDDGTEFQLQARVIYPNDYSVEDYEVFCLKTTLDTATYGALSGDSQLRGAMKPDGNVVLVVSTNNTYDRLLQLGSYDYGHSFEVGSFETGATVHHLFPDIVYTNGAYVVSYVNRTAGDNDEVVTKVLSHWFDSLADTLSSSTTQLLTEGVGDDTHAFGNSLVASLDGVLYNVNTIGDDADPSAFYGVAFVSRDLGETWQQLGYNSATRPSWAFCTIADDQESVDVLKNISACWQGNRLYVGARFGKDSQSSETHDTGSVLAFYIGGWSNQQQAFFADLNKEPNQQLCYKATYFGFLYPQYNGAALTQTGGSHLPISGRLNITTNNGEKRYFTDSAGSKVAFASAEWAIEADTFGTMAQGDLGVEFNVDNGAQRYRLGVYCLGTAGAQGGILLRDIVAGTTIATIPLDFTTEHQFRCTVYNNRFQLWYRPASSDDDEVWERAKDPFSGVTYTGYTLTAAATGANTSVAWGHFFATTTGSTGDAISNWRTMQTNFGASLGGTPVRSGIKKWFIADYIDYATTDDFHNGYPFVASPVWVTDGVYVIAAGGPTYDVDEWVISPAYQYAVENMMPEHEPSPLIGWRSETDDVDVTITWVAGEQDLDTAIADVLEEWKENESFALWLMGSNFRTAALWGVNSSDVEVKILDITLTRWSGLTFDTHGRTFVVLGGGGTNYVGLGELVGSYVLMSGITTPRLILKNTEGQLNAATKTVTVTARTDGTEDQGVDNDAGNAIFGTTGLWVTHDPAANHFKAYKLKIAAQPTAEGYFKIDKLLFGGLLVFGRPPSFGFTTEMPQDNTLRNKTQAGHTETRVYNGLPRIKQLSWIDGIDESGLSSATPDYVQYGSPADEPVALFSDTVRQIYGLFRELNGSDELVVYCDTIPGTTNTGELRPERLIYGRVTSSYQESNVLGEEGTTEVKQESNFAIEEEK